MNLKSLTDSLKGMDSHGVALTGCILKSVGTSTIQALSAWEELQRRQSITPSTLQQRNSSVLQEVDDVSKSESESGSVRAPLSERHPEFFPNRYETPLKRITISKEVEFDAGHRVPYHRSKCRNPHGHRYRVVAYCEGDIIPDSESRPDAGMLVDFSDLKAAMVRRIHDPLDHGFIVWERDDRLRDLFNWDGIKNCPVGVDEQTGLIIGQTDFNVIIFPYIPTAENMAVWCWEELQRDDLFAEHHDAYELRLAQIDVYETPTSIASYYGPEGS